VTYTRDGGEQRSVGCLNVVVVDSLPLDPKKIVYVVDSGNGACTYDGRRCLTP